MQYNVKTRRWEPVLGGIQVFDNPIINYINTQVKKNLPRDLERWTPFTSENTNSEEGFMIYNDFGWDRIGYEHADIGRVVYRSDKTYLENLALFLCHNSPWSLKVVDGYLNKYGERVYAPHITKDRGADLWTGMSPPFEIVKDLVNPLWIGDDCKLEDPTLSRPMIMEEVDDD